MEYSFVEANLHIDEAIVYPWGDVLKRVVGGVKSVQQVDLPDHMPHHLLVKYSPEYTSSKLIQNELSYLGYHTKLISP